MLATSPYGQACIRSVRLRLGRWQRPLRNLGTHIAWRHRCQQLQASL